MSYNVAVFVHDVLLGAASRDRAVWAVIQVAVVSAGERNSFSRWFVQQHFDNGALVEEHSVLASAGFEVALAVADRRYSPVWNGAFEFIGLALAVADGGAGISECVRDLLGDNAVVCEQLELIRQLGDPDGVSAEVMDEVSLMSKGVVQCERFLVLSDAL